jgi:hypothetical protein
VRTFSKPPMRSLSLRPATLFTIPRMVMTKKEEKDPNAVAVGRKGGKARLQKLTPEQRSDIARRAVIARWARAIKQKPG